MSQRNSLSRRERQIMDILYRLKEAGVREVMASMEDAPGYSSVRTLLGKLAEKGHVSFRQDGARYVYFPVVAREKASRHALGNLVRTFFDDSPLMAVNSLLDMSIEELSDSELEELNRLIQKKKQARAQGKEGNDE